MAEFSELERLLLEVRKSISALWQQVFAAEADPENKDYDLTPVYTITTDNILYQWGITEIDGVPVILEGTCLGCGAPPGEACDKEDDDE